MDPNFPSIGMLERRGSKEFSGGKTR